VYQRKVRAVTRLAALRYSTGLAGVGSAGAPVISPSLVIENWPPNATARLFIDGAEFVDTAFFRQGIEPSWNNSEARHALVVWVRHTADHPVVYRIEMAK